MPHGRLAFLPKTSVSHQRHCDIQGGRVFTSVRWFHTPKDVYLHKYRLPEVTPTLLSY